VITRTPSTPIKSWASITRGQTDGDKVGADVLAAVPSGDGARAGQRGDDTEADDHHEGGEQGVHPKLALVHPYSYA
jgi:hypothetical protein